jgi:ankyrin repeat protein
MKRKPQPLALEARQFRSAAGAGNRNSEITRLLDKYGARIVEKKDDLGTTALMWAVICGQEGAAALLLSRGANIEAKDKGGRTSLMFAAQKGHAGIVALLLGAGADVQKTSADFRRTAAFYAEMNGHTKIADMIKSWPEKRRRLREEFERAAALDIIEKTIHAGLPEDKPYSGPLRLRRPQGRKP